MNNESSKDAKCRNNIFEITAFKGSRNLEFWRRRCKVGKRRYIAYFGIDTTVSIDIYTEN